MPSNDPSSQKPIHAGFDLNAIKNALQEVEQKALHAPLTSPPPPPKPLTQLTLPPIAPPSNHLQSMPPVQVVGTDAHPRASAFDYGYGASQSPSEDESPSGISLGYGYPSCDGATFAGPSHPYSRSYSASWRLEENDITPNCYSSSFARTPEVAHLKSTCDRGLIERNLDNRTYDENHVMYLAATKSSY